MNVLIVDDEPSIREAASIVVEDAGHDAQTADGVAVARELLSDGDYELVLLDVHLGGDNGLVLLEEIRRKQPQLPVVMFSASGSIATAVEATRMGALDFLEKPFTVAQLERALALAQRFRQMEQRIEELETAVSGGQPRAGFESDDAAVRRVFDVLFKAASSSATILILGDSGTGKTVAARAVHERSPYRAKPFVTVSCPSLSRELFESELFGHVKGSFTGAVRDRWGKVRSAEGGTLFLDEIGELPMETQPKLLRLLQEREYERVGDTKTFKANVRVIAATNRDLGSLVAAGQFREDLYYRFNVISVTMPPLRQRPGDLARLTREYLDHFGRECGKPGCRLQPAAEQCLLAHRWPGNLRELRNAIERSVILSSGKEVRLTDLPEAVRGGIGPAIGAGGAGTTNPMDAAGTGSGPESSSGPQMIADATDGRRWPTLADLEGDHIRRVLASTDTLQEAADVLGIDQATLYRKRKRLGLT